MALLSEEERWRDLVGGFILAFGDIELFTYHMWPTYFKKKPAPHRFTQRTSQLVKALRKWPKRNDVVIAALVEAQKLARRRNTVAHNPLQVEVYQHSRTGQVLLQKGISAHRGRDFIDDAELTELRAAAEGIVGKLYMNLGVLHGE